MAVIAALNQKGGVGKTSTCHHLAGTLAKAGHRVLLVDNDPQASLTQGFWGPAATSQLDPAATVASLYAGDEPFPEQVIRPTGIAGVDLVPGSKAATRYNLPEPEAAEWSSQVCMRAFLDDAKAGYDVVLIDCCPNLHLASWAALVAADRILVPLQAEDYGAQGLDPVRESVEMVTAGPNPGLAMLGYLVTMWQPRLAIHKVYDAMLREQYGADVFATRVPYAADIKEAISRRLPIADYKPKGASAKAMKALADEMLIRLGSRGTSVVREVA